MRKTITIILLSIILSSCTSKGYLGLSVQFPESSKVLTKEEKKELEKKIKIKNSELFTETELKEVGILEVQIK